MVVNILLFVAPALPLSPAWREGNDAVEFELIYCVQTVLMTASRMAAGG